MWQIEVQRAERYGRTDSVAVAADAVLWGVRKQIENLNKIIEKLEE